MGLFMLFVVFVDFIIPMVSVCLQVQDSWTIFFKAVRVRL